jgi:hypothetical protein
MTTIVRAFTQLSNQELLAEVKRLTGCERQATVQLIASLMEIDARRLYLGEGCSSLFTYCTQVLHLSEHAAYSRIEAARAVDARRQAFSSSITWCRTLEAARPSSTTSSYGAGRTTPSRRSSTSVRACPHSSEKPVRRMGAGASRGEPATDMPCRLRRHRCCANIAIPDGRALWRPVRRFSSATRALITS